MVQAVEDLVSNIASCFMNEHQLFACKGDEGTVKICFYCSLVLSAANMSCISSIYLVYFPCLLLILQFWHKLKCNFFFFFFFLFLSSPVPVSISNQLLTQKITVNRMRKDSEISS